MDQEVVNRLSRDLANASTTLSADEARFLVDAYYTMQSNRIRTSNQIRALGVSDEPHGVLQWLNMQNDILENQIKRALEKYVQGQEVGRWCMSITGIGPVITAGLLAHIDIRKAPTVGHIWRFAGLDPTQKWEKKQKRPWNATLKTLCWKIGESFVKVSGNSNAFYGQLYLQRKALEVQRNERGDFKAQAALALELKKFRDDTKAKEIYLTGKLPPAHIHARAKRYVVKIFLSHLHETWYRLEFKEEPPRPFAIAILNHGHYIGVPSS